MTWMWDGTSNISSISDADTNGSGVVLAAEPIHPIPLTQDLDEEKVALGERLFHEPKLSINDTISCATCHLLDKGGTDGLGTSLGMQGSNTGLNSPTVFNSGFHWRLNWDGSAATLEEQADGPVAAAKEMGGMSWEDVIDKLKRSTDYVSAFNRAYDDGVTGDNIKDAISIFQRSLYTPNAPFDRYLRGDENAISDDAKAGYNLFKSYGCITCHQGMLVGGNMFQKVGIFGDYFADRGNVIKSDLGRYNVTQDDSDRHVFKVPSLRNITRTAPYFHDGNPKTLDEAIKLMGQYQLGVDLPQEDVDLIMQFLITLTGEYQGKPV
ncbi:cytochrome-c peroxidase [Oscillatoriales cyanobacterium LEGE 11467]|uniref:Cytochrome-c peroxidase n=2 Tax=Zarconia TaxID=2992130 RepID=A0A928VVK1_9CYAN|nr:cytochrome-c peroxidase [Zarconia navalis LEGE 11467]